MGTHTNSVLTLANSIIGVSVLAMPFCFKQCGIMLSLVLLVLSNVVTRLACYYLIKSALIEKRRNFEMLALRVLGPSGKLLVEVCMIGFLLGTCVAFFVVLGDLGAPLIAELIGAPHPADLRSSVLVGAGVFVVLPLGLLRSVRSLSSVCALSIAFYFCLALKVVGEATGHLVAGDWFDKVEFWRPAGVLQCIPIFSMALSCQTQLFEVFEWTPPTPLERAYGAVRSAVNMTMLFYMAVGFFGYVAFCNRPFNGNLLVSFSPSAASMLVRAGFVMSLAASFPLVIFPCRASIYSLLFKKGAESGQIAERRLRWISAGVVGAALGAAVMVPSIETVLGLVGSTIGVLVCVILPAVIFISRSPRPDTERLLAKVLAVCGFVTMVLSTYANLYATDVTTGPVYITEPPAIVRIIPPIMEHREPVLEKVEEQIVNGAEALLVVNTSQDKPIVALSPVNLIPPENPDIKKEEVIESKKEEEKKKEDEKIEIKEEEEKSRKEPPIPEEPRKPKKRIEDSVILKLREELRKRPILTLNEEMEKERKEKEVLGNELKETNEKETNISKDKIEKSLPVNADLTKNEIVQEKKIEEKVEKKVDTEEIKKVVEEDKPKEKDMFKIEESKVNEVIDKSGAAPDKVNKKIKSLAERMEQGVPLPLAVGHRERRETEHCDRKISVDSPEVEGTQDAPATGELDETPVIVAEGQPQLLEKQAELESDSDKHENISISSVNESVPSQNEVPINPDTSNIAGSKNLQEKESIVDLKSSDLDNRIDLTVNKKTLVPGMEDNLTESHSKLDKENKIEPLKEESVAESVKIMHKEEELGFKVPAFEELVVPDRKSAAVPQPSPITILEKMAEVAAAAVVNLQKEDSLRIAALREEHRK